MSDETKPTPPEGAAPEGTQPPAKPATPAPPAAAAPKPGPQPLDNDLVKRYKAKFGDVVREAWTDRGQSIVVLAREAWLDVARYTRDDEQFNLLSDLTAVNWPKRQRQFDVVANLYSFAKNERLRLKTQAAEGEPVASVAGVWPTANWLEREAFDMFGIVFEGHPNLKRILLPDEWQGYPLRKDYDILQQDTDWIRENLGIESGQ